MTAQTPAITLLRRDLVQAIIELANKSQGGTWSLVNCQETSEYTLIELEADYATIDLTDPRTAPRECRRMCVEIWPS